jgi:hypothetical protein
MPTGHYRLARESIKSERFLSGDFRLNWGYALAFLSSGLRFMQTTNFLPGMNPFLQARWPDAHTRLIAYIGDALSETLPNDLAVIAEESIAIDEEAEPRIRARADVAVVEQPSPRVPESLPAQPNDSTAPVTLAEPETIRVSPTRRWLEIRDMNGHLVTVIELISPSNKTLAGSMQMAARHEQLIRSGVNVVEIDLIRGGYRTLPELIAAELRDSGEDTMYLVAVGRAGCPDERQVYYCPLRERLPAFAIPLRKNDALVALDLQPLIDRCYQTGRYWQLSQRSLPPPELSSDEQAWIDQHRVSAGLIDA